MYTAAALKSRIGALSDGQFIRAWRCIETINGAIKEAGDVSGLALAFVQARIQELLADEVVRLKAAARAAKKTKSKR